jgi:hypothetical protein
MILEFIGYVLGFYIFAGLSTCLYAFVKSFESLGHWDFSITRTHVALCPYPRWLLFWLHWIVVKVRRLFGK